MFKRIIYLIGLVVIIAVGFVVYLQSTGKYGVNPLIAAILFLVLGITWAVLVNQTSPPRRNNISFPFSVLVSLCVFLAVYFTNRSIGNASFMVAAVYTSCFLLPAVVLWNWYLFKLAFEPVEISSWLLPVPYAKSNAVSLHLNSVRFAFKIAPLPGGEEQTYPVTAPGIKTLGTVFGELVYEEGSANQLDDFSDVRDTQYNWVFYIRELAGLSSRQLDPNLNLLDNRLKSNAVVTARRQ